MKGKVQVNVDVFHQDDTSVADILEKVAQEVGPEAAMQLAAIFGIEPADDPTEGQILLPPRRAASHITQQPVTTPTGSRRIAPVGMD